MYNESLIEVFLSEVRESIESGKAMLVQREKNIRTLATLGMMPEDVYDEIRDLRACHFYSGPSVDRDYPESEKIWIFKKEIQHKMIYIKFKVLYRDSLVKVLSFHFDEYND